MWKLMVAWIGILLSSSGYAEGKVLNWQKDIDFYAEKMVSNHIDPFHTLSKAGFYAEIRRIKESLRNKSKSEILIDLMRLTRGINDGHTSLPLWGEEQARFPIELKLFDNSLRVVSTVAQYKEILGAKLISVNDMPASKVFMLVSGVSPFSENEYSIAVRAASYLPDAIILKGLGILKSEDEAKFSFDVQGQKRDFIFKSSTSLELNARISHFNDEIFSAAEKISNDLWYGSSSDKKLSILNLGGTLQFQRWKILLSIF